MKRKEFLQKSAVLATSAFVPTFLTQCSKHVSQNNLPLGKRLVVIQLSGGNDGLNTFVPYENDIYRRLRPTLAIPQKKVIKLTSELGINHVMKDMAGLFDKNIISVVNSIGYPNASRSHFKSMDIWHSAKMKTKDMKSGWLGRFLDNECTDPLSAIELAGTPSLALHGLKQKGFCLSDAQQMKGAFDNRFLQTALNHPDKTKGNEKVDYLYKELVSTKKSAYAIAEGLRLKKSGANYPDTKFGQNLKMINQLIMADLPTRIYYASLSGFDTHVRQVKKHNNLLTDLSQSLTAFVKDLKDNNLFNDTLIMVFSEFGRRTKENANKGTDHGKGNNLMIIGNNIAKPGFHGDINLKDLDNGDLRFQTDFRSVYSTILSQWLDAPATKILGGRFPTLPLLK